MMFDLSPINDLLARTRSLSGPLPAECLVCIPLPNSPLVGWARLEQNGIQLVGLAFANEREASDYTRYVNRLLSVTAEQETAMLAGAFFGWGS